MRAYKIVSLSVVILLITVVFAGAVSCSSTVRYDAVPLQRPAHGRLQPGGGAGAVERPAEVELHDRRLRGFLSRRRQRRRLRGER